ncbi:hypothetical protein NM688_g6216 [Phlebia brevispora]|uniref:Uncharacterized protein n=1 Tax=Phlebia brevispora TaxID=194682 RepID=A0ACC1SIU7_9APHY|nr:hypothetical protein NM688_g6216 [Phlebia brevispora]
MHTSAASARLLRNFLYTSSHRPCQLTVVGRSIRLQPLSSYPCSTGISLTHRGRSFSSTPIQRAAPASHPPGQQSELVYCPTEDDLRDLEDEDSDGPEIELLPPEEATLEITDRAAEQLQTIAKRENNPDAALRISVESGGCHGYQYKMELAKKRKPDDYLFSHPSVKPSNIVIDAVSMSLMKGSLIDFATELIGSTFRVVENPQAKGSGCGCGRAQNLPLDTI